MRSYLILVVAVIACAGQACGAGLITMDPNAAPALANAAHSDESAVAQRISYEAWHTPVKIVLADLSKKTGVTLHAGYNLSDWQVRDRKMNIFVTDVTLAELMNSIARVMKFHWTRSDTKGVVSYRLIADRRLIADAQREATRRADELKAEVGRRRAELVASFKRLSTATEAERRQLEGDSPYLKECADSKFAELATRMFDEMPGLAERFEAGDKNTIFPVSSLTLHTQQLFFDMLKARLTQQHKKADGVESQLAKLSIHMELAPRPYESNFRRQLSYFGGMGSDPNGGTCVLGYFVDPDAESRKPTELDDMDYYMMLDAVAHDADSPNLHRKVTVNIDAKTKQAIEKQASVLGNAALPRLLYQALQKAIAESSKLGIVSDSFSVMLGTYEPGGKEDELVNTLDALGGAYKCNWEKHASILEFRRRDWFRRRASQIPDEWINAWRDELNKTATMQLDTYAQMAMLTKEQREENISSDPLLSKAIGEWWAVLNSEGLLRFYLRLTKAQRSQMFSPEGLDPHFLTNDQLQLYSGMFDYGGRWAWNTEAFSQMAGKHVIMRASVSASASGCLTYNFRVLLDDEMGTRIPGNKQSWEVPMPKV